jgi:hypothetical protein
MSISNTDLKDIALKYKIPLNGVFMKDEPPHTIYEGGYIINLADNESNNGGTHWISLYIPSHEKTIGYMDSFGFVPPQSVINWIKSSPLKNYKIAYNTKQIQNINSGGCGIYSLFFIHYMDILHKSISIEDGIELFGRLFDDDTKKNLTILKTLIPYYKNTV